MEAHHKAIYEDLLQPKSKAGKSEKPKEPEKKEVKEKTLSLAEKRELKTIRKAGEEQWVDKSLAEWPENDFRIYCCNLGNEVTE